jgi:deazaflavin-dependent oxidoreductase (nitroreductase family)
MSDLNVNDWNKRIIEEFRANGGKVQGIYEGSQLLLLTTTGRKSGKPYTVPLGYQTDADRFIIIAGSTKPDWYLNLVANPQVRVETGKESFTAIATVLEGEQKEYFLQQARKMLEAAAQRSEQYAEMANQLPGDVPVVALHRLA